MYCVTSGELKNKSTQIKIIKKSIDTLKELSTFDLVQSHKETNLYMNQKTKEIIDDLIELAGESLALVDDYSGGESETLKELEIQLEKLIEKYDVMKGDYE